MHIFSSKRNQRFSPVWLYICICKALGLINRLSQTRHLCFFGFPANFLALNCPIIDLGPGGMLCESRPDGFGRVRCTTGDVFKFAPERRLPNLRMFSCFEELQNGDRLAKVPPRKVGKVIRYKGLTADITSYHPVDLCLS